MHGRIFSGLSEKLRATACAAEEIGVALEFDRLVGIRGDRYAADWINGSPRLATTVPVNTVGDVVFAHWGVRGFAGLKLGLAHVIGRIWKRPRIVLPVCFLATRWRACNLVMVSNTLKSLVGVKGFVLSLQCP